ncbi:MAG: phosphotransferase, partial [Verrucomicrobiota bacterium]
PDIDRQIDNITRKLLYKEHYTPTRVNVEAIGMSRSRTIVSRISSYLGSANLPVVNISKISARIAIEREVSNYNEYARMMLPSVACPRLESVAHATHLSGLCYSFVGDPERKRQITFYDFCRENSVDEIRDCVENLFSRVLQSRRIDSGTEDQDWFLHDAYLKRFPNLKTVVNRVENFLKVDKNLESDGNGGNVLISFLGLEVENPISLYRQMRANRKFRSKPSHGDLHGDNILFDDSRNMYLIDFADFGEHPVHLDYIVLEIALKSVWLGGDNISYQDLIRVELLLLKGVCCYEDGFVDFDLEGDLKKIYEICKVLRDYAFGLNPEANNSDYYTGSALFSLSLISTWAGSDKDLKGKEKTKMRELRSYLLSISALNLTASVGERDVEECSDRARGALRNLNKHKISSFSSSYLGDAYWMRVAGDVVREMVPEELEKLFEMVEDLKNLGLIDIREFEERTTWRSGDSTARSVVGLSYVPGYAQVVEERKLNRNLMEIVTSLYDRIGS